MVEPQNLPALYAILDVERTVADGREPLAVALAFFSGGVRLLQVRAKQLGAGALLDLASQVVRAASPYGARVIVNDRADLAVLAGANGVHVGQDDVPPALVRRLHPVGLLGLSTHTVDQVLAALTTPATYIAVGPVFGTSTKDTGYGPVGLDFVRWAARQADRPVVAIGGITLENAPEVVDAGAASVAVISELLRGDPEARARAFVAALPE